MTKYLLCTDLDRTLIPNGTQPVSPGALEAFSQLAGHEDFTLAYVSGRHLALVEKAIKTYQLPQPDFAICDVGSSIYQFDNGIWHFWLDWQRWLSSGWSNLQSPQVLKLLGNLPELHLQEEDKQGIYKLSFYAETNIDTSLLFETIRKRFDPLGLECNLIWSIDSENYTGLLDILPARAGKLSAIRFLMRAQGFDLRHTLFAGDSGNDLDVMLSEIPSVLVANAEDSIKLDAQSAHAGSLYIAQGGWHGMNGNYSAGILEGIAHFWPEVLTNTKSDKA